MLLKFKWLALFAFIVACTTVKVPETSPGFASEPHRPQFHFTPKANWMNDPNGMVFFNNKYHLFYQYYPDSTIWGPMHWGHATSTDLVHWEHLPVALYPDSLGYIFSGSAVADINNTSGFGKDGKIPLVAIFTHHDPVGEKAGKMDFQNQSIAYSLDEGNTWTKYAGNPVLKSPGIKDFRDPKVSWYEAGKKWIMTLAVQDHIEFFSSKDLKNWSKESELGKDFGAHGGVWECPDLFPLDYNGQQVWILIASINPGGPNGGSATQYFTGQFDGNKFTPYHTDTRWIDYGPDNYAGITWSNTGARKIFLGWMSNWNYANIVPTEKWRSATTIPRDLSIEKIDDKYFVRSQPVPELNSAAGKPISLENITANGYNVTSKTGKLAGPATLRFKGDKLADLSIIFSNEAGEKVVAGYDRSSNSYFIDRSNAGKVNFEKGFAGRHTAPRLSTAPGYDLTLVLDNSSLELFADSGLSVMTSIFFPNSNFSDIKLQSSDSLIIKSMQFNTLKSMYE
ncbi:MAG: glycoside hydrolase family 32 protein [Bacteroidota bacterium]